MKFPRVLFAAPKSGSGKTMISCGVLSALLKRGKKPAAFKCGPDYIDPMYQEEVLKVPSGNLDPFFSDADLLRYLFATGAAGADLSVLEGVMGIYDGLGGVSVTASTYDAAVKLSCPVILIVDARGMSRSVIPLIRGILDYQETADPASEPLIRGVILNRCSKESYERLKREIKLETGIPLLGYVPEIKEADVKSRYLGLISPEEISDLKEKMERLGDVLEETLDLNRILAIADEAPDFSSDALLPPENVQALIGTETVRARENHPVRIALSCDAAFHFTYRENLTLLKMLGAEIVPFSPLTDAALPKDTDGLILSGGYPELFCEELFLNTSMKESVAAGIRDGLPYLAECGGMMYLLESMEDENKRQWPMCGILKGNAFKTDRLTRFGYVSLQGIKRGAAFLPQGETIRGHEFHYYDCTDPGSDVMAVKPVSGRAYGSMHLTKQGAAGFPHLFYWSNPEFAARFLIQAESYGKKRRGKLDHG